MRCPSRYMRCSSQKDSNGRQSRIDKRTSPSEWMSMAIMKCLITFYVRGVYMSVSTGTREKLGLQSGRASSKPTTYGSPRKARMFISSASLCRPRNMICAVARQLECQKPSAIATRSRSQVEYRTISGHVLEQTLG